MRRAIMVAVAVLGVAVGAVGQERSDWAHHDAAEELGRLTGLGFLMHRCDIRDEAWRGRVDAGLDEFLEALVLTHQARFLGGERSARMFYQGAQIGALGAARREYDERGIQACAALTPSTLDALDQLAH